MTDTRLPFSALCLAAALAFPGLGKAGTVVTASPPVATAAAERTLCDSILDLPTLYRSDTNPVIQQLRLIGRYHGQYYLLDSNQGGNEDWEHRRARIGVEADLFDAFTLWFNLNLNLEGGEGRFVENLEDLILIWKVSEPFKLSLGKMKAPITQEWRTSSLWIPTFERSRIVGTVAPEKLGGLLGTYEKKGWIAELGTYSNTVDDDWSYPVFEGGYSLFGSLGRKTDGLGLVRIEVLYSNVDGADNATRGFEQVISGVYENQWEAFGFVVNAVGGFGGDAAGDVYGIILMPTYDLTEKLQLVARYQFATSADPDGFSLASRYERTADDLESPDGDNYHALYAGLNYLLCGHNLKLMTGVEYTRFDQETGGTFEGWTWFSGVRLYF